MEVQHQHLDSEHNMNNLLFLNIDLTFQFQSDKTVSVVKKEKTAIKEE